MRASQSVDEFHGEDGLQDFMWYTEFTEAIEIDFELGLGRYGAAEGDTFDGMEGVVGSQVSDTLLGGTEKDWLNGYWGDDYIEGKGGDDIIAGGFGLDIIDGGDGSDTVATSEWSTSFWVDLAAKTTIDNDVLISIENAWGSNVDDILWGDGNSNTLTGLNGNDILNGRGGADTLDGSVGADTASYSDHTSGVEVTIGGYNSDGDTLISIENLTGSSFDDLLTGNTGANRLDGGSGDDVLTGGQGRDILTGGDGADRFVFSALTDSGTGSATRDRIMDLDIAAGDRIDFSALDIDPSTPAHETLTYVGTAAYSGTAGDIRISTSSNAGYTAVAIDSDGDRISNFIIEVALPVTSFDASAFLL